MPATYSKKPGAKSISRVEDFENYLSSDQKVKELIDILGSTEGRSSAVGLLQKQGQLVEMFANIGTVFDYILVSPEMRRRLVDVLKSKSGRETISDLAKTRDGDRLLGHLFSNKDGLLLFGSLMSSQEGMLTCFTILKSRAFCEDAPDSYLKGVKTTAYGRLFQAKLGGGDVDWIIKELSGMGSRGQQSSQDMIQLLGELQTRHIFREALGTQPGRKAVLKLFTNEKFIKNIDMLMQHDDIRETLASIWNSKNGRELVKELLNSPEGRSAIIKVMAAQSKALGVPMFGLTAPEFSKALEGFQMLLVQ